MLVMLFSISQTNRQLGEKTVKPVFGVILSGKDIPQQSRSVCLVSVF